MNELERRNRRVGLWTSVGIHGLLFLLLFFAVAWRAPDPPLAEYGIELNFGLDNTGAGDIQPTEPVGDQGEETTQQTNQEANADVKDPEEDSEEPVVEKADEKAVSKLEDPVVVKEELKKEVSEKETKKTETAPTKETGTASKDEVKKEVVATNAAKKGDAGNHGDDKAKEGDKGNPDGKVDAKALYGTPGGGGGGTGLNLQMSGWTWADKPALPELPDNENGRVVFEIECDENGDITRITTVEKSLSPRAEQLLKDVIRKNSLVRTSGGAVSERSTGRIIFVLKTK